MRSRLPAGPFWTPVWRAVVDRLTACGFRSERGRYVAPPHARPDGDPHAVEFPGHETSDGLLFGRILWARFAFHAPLVDPRAAGVPEGLAARVRAECGVTLAPPVVAAVQRLRGSITAQAVVWVPALWLRLFLAAANEGVTLDENRLRTAPGPVGFWPALLDVDAALAPPGRGRHGARYTYPLDPVLATALALRADIERPGSPPGAARIGVSPWILLTRP